ncbi:MAG: isoprenylcysteine carboxylmethyltransferase family protein [Planctomycetota bacterium]
MIALGNFLFGFRNALFPLVMVLLILMPGMPLFADPLTAGIAGTVIALSGQTVRAMTIGLQYIVRGGRHGRVYADDLVTGGVYNLCRNPMYVGNVLLVAGLALASNSLATLLCALVLAIVAYVAIVAAEEHYLRGKFDAAYEAYCNDVPRWLPRPGAMRGLLADTTFHWRRVILKEYGTPFAWIGILCLIVIYQLWRTGALEARWRIVQVLVAVLIVTATLWATARILKKTRRLVAD